eukprot:s3139_g2.t1
MQRKSHGVESESTAGASAVPAGSAVAADGAVPMEGGAEQTAAAAIAAESTAGAADAKEENKLEVIGQELLPVSQGFPQKGDESEKPKGEKGRFQTPSERKPQASPVEQLQIQNTPWADPNDLSSSKEKEESKTLVPVPNGPPVSYGPPSPVPLFFPEQIAQLADPRNASSMLPFAPPTLPSTLQSTLQPALQSDLPRIPVCKVDMKNVDRPRWARVSKQIEVSGPSHPCQLAWKVHTPSDPKGRKAFPDARSPIGFICHVPDVKVKNDQTWESAVDEAMAEPWYGCCHDVTYGGWNAFLSGLTVLHPKHLKFLLLAVDPQQTGLVLFFEP